MRATAANIEDLTTRARIRDAAIEVFGEQGFGAGVRTIATAAGVSPGLVNHHFGSKDGLREECDTHVLNVIRVSKSEFLTEPSASSLFEQLAEIEEYAPVFAYMVRSFQTGGALAVSLFEHMVANTAQYLADGVAAGTLRRSRDPDARARYLTLLSIGTMLLHLQLQPDTDGPVDHRRALRALTDDVMFPGIELFTEGMLADSTLLDALVARRAEHTTTNEETTG
ncbi:TetR/AcrR family transcriptional regulator [Antrihabitans cavernicola]|uniref:TetR/AcrR family transcriptional regulator n=1 Tax=Antrihabitans cavernicola TaxID=2495913 RepID=A0A5A7S9J3_9NOCA|nr:TetR family transcriptional regulator [Spelaeibacter cavernicola]KAA0022576.1 TetR/AcrR family transcriptional regulator [Spelaeibacter cavernicola]